MRSDLILRFSKKSWRDLLRSGTMITASEEADFMELRTFWKVFKRRWWIVAVPSLAALVFASYGYITRPTQTAFATSVRFTAAQPPDSEPGQSRDDRYYQWL